MECEFFALRGVAMLVETIQKVQDRLNPELEIDGLVATMYDSRTRAQPRGAGPAGRGVRRQGVPHRDRAHRAVPRDHRGRRADHDLRDRPRAAPTPTGSWPRRCSHGARARDRGGGGRVRRPRRAGRRHRADGARRSWRPAPGRAGSDRRPGARPAGSATTRRSPSTSRRTSWSRSSRPGWCCGAEHGVAVDRGRLVREAVAEMLSTSRLHGEDSVGRVTGCGPRPDPAYRACSIIASARPATTVRT